MAAASQGGLDLKAELVRSLHYHPRVAHQGLWCTKADRERLAAALPNFVPFGGRTFDSCTFVLDWDHRLPSRHLIVRLYAYYTPSGREAGQRSLNERTQRIADEDIFPEFDVADYAGLTADESYEAELEVHGQAPTKYRLASPWKREVNESDGRAAEAVARNSQAYKNLTEAQGERPLGLGDLEAAEWAAPSETGHPNWGIEVWYLRSFNGMVGEGTAFLVDLKQSAVVSQRDFQFRAG